MPNYEKVDVKRVGFGVARCGNIGCLFRASPKNQGGRSLNEPP